MFAYHNDPLIKRELVLRLRNDAKLDRIVHGQYWENGKGCAVGCIIRGSDHAEFEPEYGIPQSIARLLDATFEGLANGQAQKLPVDFAVSIPVGADLSKVTAQFLVWCLLDRKHGAIRQAPKDKFADCHNAILAAAAVWSEYRKTGFIDKMAARSASLAASSAAYSASSAYSAFWKAAAATLLKLLAKAPIR